MKQITDMGNKLSSIVKEVGREIIIYKEDADLVSHRMLSEKLNELDIIYPIISEEDKESQVEIRPSHYWLIDPVDGSKSCAGGYSGYVVQVALIANGFPRISAIYAPRLDLCYVAEEGFGAFRNGSLILKIKAELLQVIIDNTPKPQGIALEAIKHFVLNRYLEMGSISLKICHVAEGVADIFIKDVEVKDWDLAAPHLVIKEVGGILTDIDGNQIRYDGDYSHHGIVSTLHKKTHNEAIEWYRRKNA